MDWFLFFNILVGAASVDAGWCFYQPNKWKDIDIKDSSIVLLVLGWAFYTYTVLANGWSGRIYCEVMLACLVAVVIAAHCKHYYLKRKLSSEEQPEPATPEINSGNQQLKASVTL